MYIGFSKMEGPGTVTRNALGREGEVFQKLMKWKRERVCAN